MKKIFFAVSLLFLGVKGYCASSLDYECSSYTITITSGNFQISSRAFTLDMISVTNPGSSSFVEVWDTLNTTGTGKYLGKFDTTAKHDFMQGIYGIKITSEVVAYNQGSTPAGIKFFYRRTTFGCP